MSDELCVAIRSNSSFVGACLINIFVIINLHHSFLL